MDVLVGAFYRDPLWSWVFPEDDARRDQHRALFSLFVAGGLRYPWTWLSTDATAVSVWIPPGGTELSDEQEATLEPLFGDLLHHEASRGMGVMEAFDAAHPHDVDHYYLSLLGTDPGHLGHGHGLGLLRDNLVAIDELGMPAYLEASNPGNVALYRRFGFEVIGTLDLPSDAPEVATMWRPAQAAVR